MRPLAGSRTCFKHDFSLMTETAALQLIQVAHCLIMTLITQVSTEVFFHKWQFISYETHQKIKYQNTCCFSIWHNCITSTHALVMAFHRNPRLRTSRKRSFERDDTIRSVECEMSPEMHPSSDTKLILQ